MDCATFVLTVYEQVPRVKITHTRSYLRMAASFSMPVVLHPSDTASSLSLPHSTCCGVRGTSSPNFAIWYLPAWFGLYVVDSIDTMWRTKASTRASVRRINHMAVLSPQQPATATASI